MSWRKRPNDWTQDFYRSRAWKNRSKKIRKYYKNKCQRCKSLGKLTEATLVHHDKPLRDYPELAMEMYRITRDGRKVPQLIPLCDECHEIIEVERGTRNTNKKKLLTEEWDGSPGSKGFA